ncbi:MAG TPA: hypothetical protein DIS78_06355, partial [Lachnospiraceae bacterium]|nr:hypothetical protein [Lachnospiraceae bacterium]
VTLNGITLPEGEYSVTENTALNAGSYTLTVTAVNDRSCTGSIEKTFTVAKKSIIPLVTVTGSYTYTGSAIVPEYTVTDGSDTLAPTDYAYTISDNINAGQGKIRITARLKGNYSFEDITQAFTIAKATHEDVALSGSAMYGASGTIDLTAAGTAGSAFGNVEITSDVNGILDGTPLVSGKTLSYKFKDMAAGNEQTAKIKIEVSGAYNYETYYVIVTVTAGNKPDAKVTITGGNREAEYGSAGFTLTGKAAVGGSGGRWTWTSSKTSVAEITNTGAVTIKGMGSTLITAKYESDTAVGEASITLTVTQKTLGITWSNVSFEYDGTPHRPTAVISGVVRGDDCQVSVSGGGTDMGSYTAAASLTGADKDNYRLPADGSICSFTIGKLSISNVKIILGTPLTYTGSEQVQEVTKIELNGMDITPYCNISNNTAKNAGSYTLRVTAGADSNYTGTAFKQFSIAKKSVTPLVTVTGTHRYTGEPINPDFTVMAGTDVLEATEYTVSVTDNTEAGEGKITITPASGGNYIFGPVTKKFTIEKANHEDVTASGGAKPGMRGSVDLAPFIEEGGSLGRVSISDPLEVLASKPSVSGTSLTFTFQNEPEKMSESALVTVPVREAKNYLDYSVKVTLTVTNCEHEHTVIKNKKEASCIEEGYTGDVYCTDCGLMIEQGKPTPVDPTKHVYDRGVITKEPTVYTVGIRTYTCIYCGHTYTEPVARLDGEEDLSDLIDDITDDDGLSRGEVRTGKRADGSEETTFIVDNRVVEKVVTGKDGDTNSETCIWVGGLKSRYTYTGSPIKPEFHVYDGTRKLGSSDYIYKYSNNTAVGNKAAISIRFRGDYKATEPLTVDFAIVPAYLGSDIVAGDIGIVKGKKEQKPVPVMTMAATGKSVNKKNFEFTYKDRTGNVIPGVMETGTYTVEVTSRNENIVGKTTAVINVSGDKSLLLSRAAVKFSPDSYIYEGWPIVPPAGSYKLTLNGRELKEGTDYAVGRIMGNVAPGTATVEFVAVDGNEAGYVGSKTASFKIVAGRQIKWGEGFSYSYDDSVSYVKSGAKPRVTVRDMGTVLKEGTDYTVSYSKNRAVTDGKTAQIRVKGIGKYKGSVTLKYEILKQHIGAFRRTITADDKVVSKKGCEAPAVTVTDLNGNQLSAGKDYKIDPDSYVIVGPDGKTTDTAAGGDTIYVDLVGAGNYEGRVGISYRYVNAPIKLSKAGAGKIKDKVYTGREVRLTDDDLTNVLYAGSKKSPVYLKPGKDFIVAGYSKNIKTGTAKVTLQGMGDYSGMKALSFKITAKKGDYGGTLIDGVWR